VPVGEHKPRTFISRVHSADTLDVSHSGVRTPGNGHTVLHGGGVGGGAVVGLSVVVGVGVGLSVVVGDDVVGAGAGQLVYRGTSGKVLS